MLGHPYGGNVSVNANGGNTGAGVTGADGAVVGLDEGDEGNVDGENEIWFDGSVEGAIDGSNVGTIDGSDVGTLVGFDVGTLDGSTEGELDGLVVFTTDDAGLKDCWPTSAAMSMTISTTTARNTSHPRRPEQQGSCWSPKTSLEKDIDEVLFGREASCVPVMLRFLEGPKTSSKSRLVVLW